MRLRAQKENTNISWKAEITKIMQIIMKILIAENT